VFPHQAAGVAPVHVRQLDIQDDEIGPYFFGLLDALTRRRGMLDPETFMQLELLGQGFAEFLIIVDQQDRLCGGHVVGVSQTRLMWPVYVWPVYVWCGAYQV
jgi:hypothetical protein